MTWAIIKAELLALPVEERREIIIKAFLNMGKNLETFTAEVNHDYGEGGKAV